MAKSPKKAAKEIELEPDAWQRFEKFIGAVTKAPPKHRTAAQKSSAGSRASPKRGSGK